MKNNLNRYIALFVLILIGSGVYLFLQDEEPFENITSSKKHQIDDTYLIKPTNGIENVYIDLKRLDSAIGNKELTILSKVKVFDYKRYVYEAFVNDYEKAHTYADSAIAIISGKDPVQYKNEYSIAYLCKGDVFYSQSQYNEAFAYYYKAKQMGLGFFNDCFDSEYSYRIGMIYYKQGSYEDAKNNFINAFEEAESCPDVLDNYHRRQQVLSNVGLSYHQLKDYKNAEKYYQLALKFITENSKKFPTETRKHNEAIGVVYGNLAHVYLDQNKYAIAKPLLKKNIAYNLSRGNDIRNAQTSYLGLADLYLREKQLDSAYLTLQKIKITLDSLSTDFHLAEWNKHMNSYYVQKNNKPKAYDFLQQYLIYNEAWISSKESTTKTDLKKQYDLFEHQHKLEVLQSEYKIKNLILFITAFIGIIVFLLLIFIWLNWKKSTKNVLKLNKLNHTILSQNKELENAFTTISESSKEKEKLLNIVAHDLRTPIASLSLLVDLVLDKNNAKERNELLDLMKVACRNALDLISETLKLNKDIINHDQNSKVLIGDFLTENITLLRILSAKKEIAIDLHVPKEKILVTINTEKFKRVINNLVSNAIKFSQKETTIKISAVSANNKLLISIKDQGIGIQDDIISRIFELEPLEYKRSGTDGEKSFGLGLPFCKQVVEEHDGTIWIESSIGKGSTFFIEIPLS